LIFSRFLRFAEKCTIFVNSFSWQKHQNWIPLRQIKPDKHHLENTSKHEKDLIIHLHPYYDGISAELPTDERIERDRQATMGAQECPCRNSWAVR
jgi:hypothetical protein